MWPTRPFEEIFRSPGKIISTYVLATLIYVIVRAREHELLYVLRKLLELKLWPGSLWSAVSDDPSKYCIEQPGDLRNPCLGSLLLTYRRLDSY